MDKPAAAPAPLSAAFSTGGAGASATDARPTHRYDAPAAPPTPRYPRAVRYWLLAGLALIFVQVVVGGITRLTGSGLSITKWEIVTGTLPPLSEAQWLEEFALYRATPQYEKMNAGMPLEDFKFIYFWEYFHRLWARMMGLAFVVPLGYFLARGYIDRALGKRLGLVFAAAALTASFGWIMVASGLIDRPLVNAYKLSMHLAVAFATFGILLWTTFFAFDRGREPALSEVDRAKPSSGFRSLIYWTAGVLAFQILLGGMMSGMRAALFYPTWPDLNGEAVPAVLFDAANWTWANVVDYDAHPFMAALVQVLHRTTAYVVTALVAALAWVGLRADGPGAVSPRWRTALRLIVGLTAVQVALGIATVVLSVGEIPVLWGVLHQAGALLLMAAMMWGVWLALGAPGVGRRAVSIAG